MESAKIIQYIKYLKIRIPNHFPDILAMLIDLLIKFPEDMQNKTGTRIVKNNRPYLIFECCILFSTIEKIITAIK